ncbi:L,D-transpeptidase family protein [Bacillus salacetis]|uniref:L,D-transpeptidase family protein n=1 Tax=Bacillus salacetis TaxID=2315464 RepID=UPI003BA19FF8
MSRLFDSHVKKNLDKLHKNLYLSKNDPEYYEKVLRYKDPQSPEAHFRLAQKWEEEGVLMKAYLHYEKAAQVDSPYYYQAKAACKSLEKIIEQPPAQITEPTSRVPFRLKAIIGSLILLNLCILALLFWKADSLTVVASQLKAWGTDMEVVYETEDIPYVFYIPADTPPEEVENSLYKKALSMGKELSNKNVLLYGVRTTDSALSLETLPLKSNQIKEQAFVIAEYNSALDQPVRIRFLNNTNKEEDPYTYTYISTNLLRTALKTYIDEKGAPPTDLKNLTADYPDNYLSFIPKELYHNSNGISPAFTGNGGWVYNANAQTIDEMLYPNIMDSSSKDAIHIPFNPVEIEIDKNTFTLTVKNSPYIIATKPIGLGKNNSTPEGTFFIQNRVLEPQGDHQNMFGAAGLGMGDYAIHGTSDEQSIGQEKSHGCIRLLNEDVQGIFDYVPKGAAVNIVDQPPSIDTPPNTLNPDLLSPETKPVITQTADEVFEWAG